MLIKAPAQIVREAIGIGAKSVWIEPHLEHRTNSAEARSLAAKAGVDYMEDECVAMERARSPARCAAATRNSDGTTHSPGSLSCMYCDTTTRYRH